MKWHECTSCDAEFRVVSDSHDTIEFCPYCGEPILHEEEALDIDEDFEE